MMTLAKDIAIKDRRIGEHTPVYLIGEIACAHQGDPDAARGLIDAVAEAGADCVQLQIFDPDANMAPTSPLHETLRQIRFDEATWRGLVEHAKSTGLALSLFVYDEPSLELGLSLEPDLLKLNSSELANPRMLHPAGASGLPITLGTGASSFREVGAALEILLGEGNDRIILTHGVQNFPTTVADAAIRRVSQLRHLFDGLVLYADHTDAEDPMSHYLDLLALGQGASLLEKHIILERGEGKIDGQAALTPEEFRDYVSTMRKAWEGLGPAGVGPFSDSELRYRRFQKKSMVAARPLAAGETLTAGAVAFLRVQGESEGIAPMGADAHLGKRLRHDLAQYQQIQPGDLD